MSDLVRGWEVVIGLEIHAQVASKTKLFSGIPTSGDAKPNSRVNFFDAGMPGMLPVINSFCIDQAIKTGLALHGQINLVSIFDRKNYFYPDLPTGYQISQFFYPIVSGGYVDVSLCAPNDAATPQENNDVPKKRIKITRIHLEQDAGKNIHDLSPEKSFIDLNRAGVALMEIVTEPDMRSAAQAVSVAKKIHSLVQYVETCDGNMEQGNFRIDANVSVHKPNTEFGTRVEIKNLNSFKFMQTALLYEIERQIEAIESGSRIVQETRLFDASKNTTATMRDKENADDYRYFKDPDLPPLVLTDERIQRIAKSMPELPDAKQQRFMEDFGLNEYDSGILTSDRKIGDFYEAAVGSCSFPDYKKACKQIANWIIVDLFRLMKESGLKIDKIAIKAEHVAQLVLLIQEGTISGKIAKTVFERMWSDGGVKPAEVVEALGLQQISSVDEILPEIRKILDANAAAVEEYNAGKESVFAFLVGQIMKRFKGKAAPDLVNRLLREALGEVKKNNKL
jgi:aspartyl-tRNA(Asn)/glutamyl-tRNA(Gln) amidotransferase subunit B